ncbi:hypothetical protein JMJ77_0012473 [Colletotrichum scovillei]|uniref:PH domain-containing protein n=1 Tax=Colletotrichum scovillei TaxID=1209932 RepID=A0A9P7QSX4_9PEZI|nr:hypothetical protein JMJ78_0001487 [Colletotrichum scovillei]KAG7041957.1 hypothetical protein JMJ77_0012473 [Colletotrichum scovillei]KAG7061988.1 hypothetical protein JMJ76_0003942 [Colletotrichum scovillei]
MRLSTPSTNRTWLRTLRTAITFSVRKTQRMFCSMSRLDRPPTDPTPTAD